jgi:hypothetical protein
MKRSESLVVGRIVGGLLLAHVIVGSFANLMLIKPGIISPAFLVAPANARTISLLVSMGLMTGLLVLGVAITSFPLLRYHNPRLARWFFVLASSACGLLVIENAALLIMLSLIQASSKASNSEVLPLLVQSIRSLYNGAHSIQIITSAGMFFIFYGTLYHAVLVPRTLTSFGLLTVILQVTTIAGLLFDIEIVLILPATISHLLLSIWLLARGFAARPSRWQAEISHGAYPNWNR